MRILFSLLCLFAAVRGNVLLKREIDEPRLEGESRELHPWRADGALGGIMAPRAESGAVASQICGYLGGQINQPWVCAVGSLYCVIEPNESVVGCCYSNFCGAFHTSCVAQTDPCDTACSSNDQILRCSGSKPLCATYSYPSYVTEVKCESTIPSVLSVAYTYSGFSTPILLPRIAAGFSITGQGASFSYLSLVTGTQSPPSSTAAPITTITAPLATSTTSSSSSNSITSTPAPVTTSSAASTSAAPVASNSNSTPVGPIVGGVIGGLALIVAIVALLVYLWFKKNQNKPPNAYPQMKNSTASAFELPPTTSTSANERKDDQTRNMVYEAYAPPDRNAHTQQSGGLNELPGQMVWA